MSLPQSAKRPSPPGVGRAVKRKRILGRMTSDSLAYTLTYGVPDWTQQWAAILANYGALVRRRVCGHASGERYGRVAADRTRLRCRL
jgi:hypothetical protein